MPTMAASTGTVLQAGAMRAELPLTMSTVSPTAGIDGVDGDEVVAFGFAGRIDRTRDEQLAADQPLVLARGDDGADDFGEDHGQG